METNRKDKREFGVYDQEMNRFYNMDCISILDDQHLDDIPEKGYTYEEAQRFIVHCDNKKSCKIVNIKQPKYLLNFEIEYYRKEQASINAKENMRYLNNAQHIQAESNAKRKNKESYFTALGVFKTDSLKRTSVTAKQLEERKPKMEEYGLTSEDFDTQEKSRLHTLYDVTLKN
ncbi:MAG: hypothetical protein CL605_03215 [Altibacter sp.]|uniref:hypothetical protein n=1 Tax=Altibacter sp. TaxID=2024823 RepID=UPI000C989092|nr:hypothetical protein [Altibacter sp.]MAP53890.1 hypothetical protein [Altibacter sp.]|tara:strand:- start:4141 stop:4662 length:522 start_codon:yes stop_codon:yes gene_type:complete